ncbi:MAG: homocysteine S-methyltransferase family protein [Clostridiales Family XIII bacterium]|jgi:5-methyltetrahydrofolate--homocysteine methyltransferase|nr:homocysteine S-methyltransferase family protein [Clostridiales Family XIII bacterium]
MNNDLAQPCRIAELLGKRSAFLLDAATGTALLASGQPAGTGSEEMNLSSPEKVLQIHAENIAAGSDVVTTNTFGVTQLFMRGKTVLALRALEDGVRLARRAAGASPHPPLVALDIGPAGCLLGPLGTVSYEAAAEAVCAQVEAGARCGADFVLLETFADTEEFGHAARAAKKSSGLPVLGTMTFGESGRSFMGAAPADLVREARAAGLAAVGANCSLGPDEMAPVIEQILRAADGLPVIAQPNAGQPVIKDGAAVYEMPAEAFAESAKKLLALGIKGIGGCCGTTPAMIAALRSILNNQTKG